MRYTKIFLIDSENVGTPDITKYIAEKDNAKVIVFHNEHFFPLLAKEGYSFIRVETKNRKNALDFVLSTYLGSLLSNYGVSPNYFIVSNDRDYSPVLDYWNEKGYNVKQLKIEHNQVSTIPHFDPTDNNEMTLELAQKKIKKALEQQVIHKEPISTKLLKTCKRVQMSQSNKGRDRKHMEARLLGVKGVNYTNVNEILDLLHCK